MNKKAKIAVSAAVGTAVAAGAVYGTLNVLDRLLVDRKWETPEALKKVFAGDSISSMADICERNRIWLENYGYERYSITNSKGQKLIGYLLRPKEKSNVFVFGCHGYRSNGKDEFNAFAQYYLKKGYNVFLVDAPGAGNSDGKYIGFGFFEYQSVLEWLDFINTSFGEDIQLILHGVSMGAATVMLLSGCGKLPENVKFIVSDCGYTSVEDEFTSQLDAVGVPEKLTSLILRGVNGINKKRAGYDFFEVKPIEAVKKATVPMLFVHGATDGFVPSYMANEVYEACSSEYKDLLFIEGADHAQSYIKGMQAYEDKLEEFEKKFLTAKEEAASKE